MFELMPVVGMVFILLVLMLIGGFILLLPLTRRLGAYLEQRLEQGKAGATNPEIRQLRAAVGALQAEIERLAERQEFTESLLASPSRSSSGAVADDSTGEPRRVAPPEAGA